MNIFAIAGFLIIILLLLINIVMDYDRRNATKSRYYDPRKINRK